jgi:hypothetical protein
MSSLNCHRSVEVTTIEESRRAKKRAAAVMTLTALCGNIPGIGTMSVLLIALLVALVFLPLIRRFRR